MYTGACMNQVTEMQVQDPVLGEIVRRLVDDCQPERIYPFGSRARGNAGADSDYDIMVGSLRRFAAATPMQRLIFDYRFCYPEDRPTP